MFWSKIWLLIVAAAAAVAITVALLLPRPAQRARLIEERQRLVVACDVVNIQLKDSARIQVEVAGAFARQPPIIGALDEASGADTLDANRNKTARELAADTIAAVDGTRPDFAILIDRRGRVVARAGVDEAEYGDTLAGRWLVDDALAGYLRDDMWFINDHLYRVSASPVIKVGTYVGAVVIGNAVSKEYAEELMRPLGASIAFYVDGQNIASSTIVAMDRVIEEHGKLAASGGDIAGDCRANKPFTSRAGKEEYSAVVSRLPGEAQSAGAFYTVFMERPKAAGLAATLDQVRKDDLGFSNFPWPLVGLGFLAALGIGLGLMILEADRPVRKLAADSVRLAKAQIERLPEEQHHGRFGSISRSINIQIDKLAREARAARRDLDQLLGPGDGEGGGLGTLDLGGPMPPRSEAPRPPPPPSEFRFSEPLPPPELDLSSGGGSGPRAVAARAAAAPPLPGTAPGRAPAPPSPPRAPRPAAPPAPPMSSPHLSGPAINPALIMAAPGGLSGLHELLATDDSVGSAPAANSPEEEAAFRTVFNEFVELKKRCGEPTAGLTYPKFADKLRKNRDDLMAKPGCIGVKFSVYVKDGKAALKATPVKSE